MVVRDGQYIIDVPISVPWLSVLAFYVRVMDERFNEGLVDLKVKTLDLIH